MKVFTIYLIILIYTTIDLFGNIVYTDITPDTVITGVPVTDMVTYGIDLDKNGSPDYYIGQHHYGPNMDAVQMFCTQYGESEVLIDDNQRPLGLEKGFLVNSTSGQWYNSYSSSLDMTSSEWLGAKDKYIGLRFKKSGNYYYGWVRVDVAPEGTSVTIKDFAYDDSPGRQITTGDIGGTNVETKATSDKIEIRIIDRELEIVPENQSNLINIAIYDVIGRRIISHELSGQIYRYDFGLLADGLYFIEVIKKEQRFVQKFVIN